MLLLCLVFFLIGHCSFISGNEFHQEEEQLRQVFLAYAKFYELPHNVDLVDITENLLQSSDVKESRKELIKQTKRRMLLFMYPSDGLKIKGLISYIPDGQDHPLLVLLRGGNRLFGILNPACDLMCASHYTIITTTYRGGVSEGEDEFGGHDVNDVKNLIDYIPQLEKRIGSKFRNHQMFMVGVSRGGMQMFLALSRFPELQNVFTKVVSLSGLLDLRSCIASRPDMEEMFIDDFGLIKGVNEEEWIQDRDPQNAVDKIRSNLPILIIQGTDDKRVKLEEGYHWIEKFQIAGKDVTYCEIEGGDHCLTNHEDRTKLILRWLEE